MPFCSISSYLSEFVRDHDPWLKIIPNPGVACSIHAGAPIISMGYVDTTWPIFVLCVIHV